MSDVSLGEVRRLLAAEFEAQGWEYDLTTGKAVIERAEEAGRIEPIELARAVPGGFLQSNGVTRDDVAEAIGRALGGRTLRPDEARTTVLNFDNRSYTLRLGSGGQISGSQVNVGGTQINVQAGARRDEILAGVRALFRAGLDGDWSPEVLNELAATIASRADIGFEDVESVVIEAAEAAPDSVYEGRLRGMLSSITEQGIGGALGTGISAAVGWLLRNPPV